MNLLKLVSERILPKLILRKFLFYKKIWDNRDLKTLKEIDFLKTKDKAIVLGNGPSLNNDLEKIVTLIDDYDFICVNNFCSNSFYETIKPNKYVFLDAYFFSKDAHPDWIQQRNETFEIINKLTTWKMQIFLPMGADETILKDIIKNQNIEIIKIKVFAIHPSKEQLIKKYGTGMFGPLQCNVLIYAIYLSVWSKYKQIRIYGADLSFHNDTTVNQKNNNLEIVFRHFNKPDQKERLMKNPEKIEPFTMAELMQTTADTFKAHELINIFSKHNNVDIFNCSSYSLIDTYKRLK